MARQAHTDVHCHSLQQETRRTRPWNWSHGRRCKPFMDFAIFSVSSCNMTSSSSASVSHIKRQKFRRFWPVLPVSVFSSLWEGNNSSASSLKICQNRTITINHPYRQTDRQTEVSAIPYRPTSRRSADGIVVNKHRRSLLCMTSGECRNPGGPRAKQGILGRHYII